MTIEQETRQETDGPSARHASRRGRFEIFHLAEKPAGTDAMAADDVDNSEGMDLTGLLDNHEESEVRAAVDKMWRALLPGMKSRALLYQPGSEGMSVIHSWFGPNLQFLRHSHPGLGDCVYYVSKGELTMGSKVLKSGDGWFQPSGAPYKFRAGPDGVEVVEFRADPGTEGAAVTKIDESSLAEIERITELAEANHDIWVASRT